MISHIASAGFALAKRASEGPSDGNYDLPPWAIGVIFLTTLVFVPAFLVVNYTLGSVYPTLAIIEDPSPPAYEPLAANDEADATPTAVAFSEPKPVTSKLRSTNRLLYSVGGWRASFRGFFCALAIGVATSLVGGIFAAIPFVPYFFGTLLATLALIQLHTAWVHIVISNPSSLPFWKRLPAFRRTFEATCIPVFVAWIATTLSTEVPGLLSGALGMPTWDPSKPSVIPDYDHSTTWKSLVVGLVGLALGVFLVIPAQVVLVRVQASLLPPEEDTIVPFDRSFDGTVEPAIIDGKGYVTFVNALKTFSRSSWIRLYVLYLKIFLVTLAVAIVYAAVIVPEVVFTARKHDPVN